MSDDSFQDKFLYNLFYLSNHCDGVLNLFDLRAGRRKDGVRFSLLNDEV